MINLDNSTKGGFVQTTEPDAICRAFDKSVHRMLKSEFQIGDTLVAPDYFVEQGDIIKLELKTYFDVLNLLYQFSYNYEDKLELSSYTIRPKKNSSPLWTLTKKKSAVNFEYIRPPKTLSGPYYGDLFVVKLREVLEFLVEQARTYKSWTVSEMAIVHYLVYSWFDSSSMFLMSKNQHSHPIATSKKLNLMFDPMEFNENGIVKRLRIPRVDKSGWLIWNYVSSIRYISFAGQELKLVLENIDINSKDFGLSDVRVLYF